MEIIRHQPKTYRTRRRKPAPKPKAYRVVSEEVDGATFRRTEFVLRWTPWLMGGVLMIALVLAASTVRKQWLNWRIAHESCVNQTLWLEPDPGWRVPRMDEELLKLCYEREQMF